MPWGDHETNANQCRVSTNVFLSVQLALPSQSMTDNPLYTALVLFCAPLYMHKNLVLNNNRIIKLSTVKQYDASVLTIIPRHTQIHKNFQWHMRQSCTARNVFYQKGSVSTHTQKAVPLALMGTKMVPLWILSVWVPFYTLLSVYFKVVSLIVY